MSKKFVKHPWKQAGWKQGGLILAVAAMLGSAGAEVHAQEVSKEVANQIASLEQEKESRTPAQQKMDSQLIYASKMSQGYAISSAVKTLEVEIPETEDGGVLVDISGEVTPDLLQQIVGAGGTVESAFPEYKTIRAILPLEQIEGIAENPAVRFIGPADLPHIAGSTAPQAGVKMKQFGFAPSSAVKPAIAPPVAPAAPLVSAQPARAKRPQRDIAHIAAQIKAIRQKIEADRVASALGLSGLSGADIFSNPAVFRNLAPFLSVVATSSPAPRRGLASWMRKAIRPTALTWPVPPLERRVVALRSACCLTALTMLLAPMPPLLATAMCPPSRSWPDRQAQVQVKV